MHRGLRGSRVRMRLAALASPGRTRLVYSAALLLTASAGAGVESATAKTFRNCTALNRVYPHGVGRTARVGPSRWILEIRREL